MSAMRVARPLGLASLLAVALLGWGRAPAAAKADAQLRRGAEIAQLLCSACHVVAEHQKYPPLLEDPAPSFRGIANRPHVSAAALRHFVATTHWDPKTLPLAMPNPGLSDPDIAAVIRYILSLKGQ
jgi:mono/diheme cytochrome c family protein